MKLWPFKVLSGSVDKLIIQVQPMTEEKQFHPGRYPPWS